MINEDMAKEINSVLEKDFPNTNKLIMKQANGDKAVVTITNDIEALKRRLDAIARVIATLQAQL